MGPSIAADSVARVSIQVIVLNGGSSSGKSGVARCLQAVLPEPCLALGTDTLIEAAPSSSPTSATGIEFGPAGQVVVGPEFRALEDAWMTGIAAMARAGAHVIIDEVFLSGPVSQQRWRRALGSLPVLWVGVRCDREVATAREIARGDRVAGMAAIQADLVHQGMAYDLEVDTSQTEALDCARIIADHVKQLQSNRPHAPTGHVAPRPQPVLRSAVPTSGRKLAPKGPGPSIAERGTWPRPGQRPATLGNTGSGDEMRITDAPPVDVRGPLTAQRGRLLDVLTGLDAAAWDARTVAPQWSVKDIALHLIDVDLSWLTRHRDRYKSGFIPGNAGHEEFVRLLAQRNQQWIDGTRVLSPQLIIDMLRWAGTQLDTTLATVDLTQPSSVFWAGDAPLWFDLAREFTERWAHFQQISEATRPAGPGPEADDYLPLVMRTFIWGFPHQYRALAPAGTTVGLAIDGVGTWTLTRSDAEWLLDEGRATNPAASLRSTGDAAWRLLTGAPHDSHQVQLSGDPTLAQPLLQVHGIIV